jgi:asparagine synthase (glutamine-hydrolysing)|tara:strand:+ start:1206 stop:3098 length:1893 start_codon:yes stop_codon:yes gene_type:complete
LNGEPVDQAVLDRFTDSLTHRGPNGRGTYIDTRPEIGLGHRRLAILDLSKAGQQPMSYANDRYWITYNGEVYNFLELKQELARKGHRFRSESDTEVILAAYTEWGEECQLRFNGMWAFAIWDSRERRLFLSRDRFGVKPLHYLDDGKHLIFASELKAFMSLNPPLRPDFDLAMVARMSNSDTIEETLLKGVKILLAGNSLTLKEGSTPQVRRWWNTLDHLVDVPKSFDDQVQQYKELFFDACKIRMRSDVPIATALSGGLDSSSVLCAMADIRSKSLKGQRLAEEWQRAFVLVYSGTSHNERHYADKVIQFSGVQPVYKEIDPNGLSLDDLVSAIYSFEAIQEPAIGPWLIYREMSDNGIAVSMDGHGGDETLAGYHHYPEIALNDAIFNLYRWRGIKKTWRGLYNDEIPDGFVFSEPSYVQFIKSKLPKAIKPRLPNGRRVITDLLATSPRLYQELRSVYRKSKADFDHLNGQLYDDFHHTILPTILRNFDRLSMAHGVEIRAPFMDWRLVCYAFSLPSDSKLGVGFTKRILRESMRGVLPEVIRLRKSKIGFASPMNEWYKNALKPFVLDSVNSHEFLESSIWNGPVIRNFVEDSYKKEDYRNAQKSWKYIQAMHLMNLFHQNSSASA